jgi:hypothetical protein
MSKRQQRRKLHQRRLRTQAGVVGGGALALALISTGTAEATQPTFAVTSLSDSGAGTLRAAVTSADAAHTTTGSPALITFASNLSGSIKLQSDLPYFTDSIDIRGPGAGKVTINTGSIGAGAGQPVISEYEAHGISLTISGLSMDDSVPNVDGDLFTSSIGATDDTVNLMGDTFSNDSGTDGTVTAIGGSLTIDNCTFSHDQSTKEHAGAVYVFDGDHLTIADSTFNDDSAPNGDGGAVSTVSSLATINDSTFTDDSAINGGALTLSGSNTTITGSTINGNHADDSSNETGPDGYGGGISMFGGGLTLHDTIVADSTETGNPKNLNQYQTHHNYTDLWVDEGATFLARFSLFSHNPGDFDPNPATVSLNSSDLTGQRADLNPLSNSGGQTETERPRLGSPVINSGLAFGLTTDQRGDTRSVEYPGVANRNGSGGTDIGAVELQAPKKPKRRR